MTALPSTFHRDLATGLRGERKLMAVLRQAGFECEHRDDYCPGYDLIASAKIEVKTDIRAKITGNIFVETAHNGRPSGLTVTTATLWAFIVGNDILLIATGRLRELASEYPSRRFVLADGVKTGHLLPLETLREHVILLDYFEKEFK
jgi:hypothetical protein